MPTLGKAQIASIQLVRERDVAPLVELQLEDGPWITVHPSVRGLSIYMDTHRGDQYVLETYQEDQEDDPAWDRGFALVRRIEEHLDAGKALNLAFWRHVRTIYGTAARDEEEFFNIGRMDWDDFYAR